MTLASNPSPPTDAFGWALVLAIARWQRRGDRLDPCVGFRRQDDGAFESCDVEIADILVGPEFERGWRVASRELAATDVQILDIYVPILANTVRGGLVLAHLAQSLDGRVATESGASQFISAKEDLIHTHRLRALFDAVLVGARTVECDDPRLTTRLVSGPSPARVIIDPRGRLKDNHRVFSDPAVPTYVVREAGSCGVGVSTVGANLHHVSVDGDADGLSVHAMIAALAGFGLKRIFVEGGGVTVSRFLESSVLDRLHVTVAPVILGSGRPAFSLPPIDDLDAAIRLDARTFALGPDILFDCPLRRSDLAT